jgi:hypothetical protein
MSERYLKPFVFELRSASIVTVIENGITTPIL